MAKNARTTATRAPPQRRIATYQVTVKQAFVLLTAELHQTEHIHTADGPLSHSTEDAVKMSFLFIHDRFGHRPHYAGASTPRPMRDLAVLAHGGEAPARGTSLRFSSAR